MHRTLIDTSHQRAHIGAGQAALWHAYAQAIIVCAAISAFLVSVIQMQLIDQECGLLPSPLHRRRSRIAELAFTGVECRHSVCPLASNGCHASDLSTDPSSGPYISMLRTYHLHITRWWACALFRWGWSDQTWRRRGLLNFYCRARKRGLVAHTRSSEVEGSLRAVSRYAFPSVSAYLPNLSVQWPTANIANGGDCSRHPILHTAFCNPKV